MFLDLLDVAKVIPSQPFGDGNDTLNETSRSSYAWVPGLDENPALAVGALQFKDVNSSGVSITAQFEEAVLQDDDPGYLLTFVTLTIEDSGEVISFAVNTLVSSNTGFSEAELLALTSFEIIEFADQTVDISLFGLRPKEIDTLEFDSFEFISLNSANHSFEPDNLESEGLVPNTNQAQITFNSSDNKDIPIWETGFTDFWDLV